MTGTYEHSIDAKGRLFIPAKLREELGVTFYLAMGVDACLAIYPQPTRPSVNWTARAVSSFPRSCAGMPVWTRTW